MTVTTAGAVRVPVDGPRPRAPKYTLLSVAQEFAVARWQAGVSVVPYPSGAPDSEDPCGDGTLGIKSDPEALTLPAGFPSFLAYLGEVCTSYSIGADPEQWRAWQERAAVALMARISFALERQWIAASFVVEDGEGNPVPHLADGNADVLAGGAAQGAATAVGYLEDALGNTGQDGVLVLTPAVVAYLGYANFEEDRTGRLTTARGTTVIVADGATGDWNRPVGEAAAAAGQSWCYATTFPLAQVGDRIILLPESRNQATDLTTNEAIYRAEIEAAVAWDTTLQAAVLADWSP
jgi:hypothetical protein